MSVRELVSQSRMEPYGKPMIFAACPAAQLARPSILAVWPWMAAYHEPTIHHFQWLGSATIHQYQPVSTSIAHVIHNTLRGCGMFLGASDR